MLAPTLRSILAEPRAPAPPARQWWDRVLVPALTATVVAEAVLRPDLPMRPLAVAVALVVMPALLWRRTRPLLATTIGFGGALVLQLPSLLGASAEVGLDWMIVVLLLPYSLYRWASGRDALIGTAVVAVPVVLGLATTTSNLGEVVGGTTVVVASFALGAAMRFRAVAQQREVHRVRTHERGELARELHDTVAHHVSAIAIQAQAGRAVAATDPSAAVEALAVIEAEASQTLAEMRSVVRVLREGEADFAPQRGIADVEELARMSPLVSVSRSGPLTGLSQPLEVAVYRICQEAVTNAIRHSFDATAVTVQVTGDADVVRLRVHDDGAAPRPATAVGYGLLGMAERAKLLGGTCQAGPDPAGGWTVEATLPREVPQ